MSFESVLKLFKKMDLGMLDARVYLSLLSSGSLSVSRLSEELGVSRPQVYASLNKLFSRGLVERSGGKPVLYRAVEPSTVVKAFESELKKLGRDSLYYLSQIKRKEEARHNIWVLRSRMGLYRRFKSTIREAEKDLIIRGSVSFIRRLLKEIINAQKRGVIVYTMTYNPLKHKEYNSISYELKYLAKTLSKLRIALPGDHYIIRDSSLAVISYEKWRAFKRSSYGLVVEEPILINYIVSDFFRNWYESKEICDKEVKLPVSLTFHKLALLEIDKLLKKGMKLVGSFKGWWTYTGRRGVVEGEITDTFIDTRRGLMYFGVHTEGGYIRVGGPDATIEEFAMEEVTIFEDQSARHCMVR
ncbi:MAG: hypothetical protein DRN53_04300 [Thermoprotei archaeon]|nr:MAG: hypothetical protein DRN53_04300 [Thermoprotei archaeon]